MPLKMPQVQTQYFPFVGGLDQVTPPIQMPNGALRYGVNVEIGVRGGYSTIAGYERYSGQTKPSDASYALLPVTLTGTVSVGDVVTDNAAVVSGTVIAIESPTVLVLTKITGTFPVGPIKVGVTVVGSATASQAPNGASTPLLNAQYTALAANVYRALVMQVPGAGPILGVHQYRGNVYAFRNNAAGTAAVMFKDSAAGWVPITFGRELRFAQRQSTVTITIASPAVITWNAHALAAGQKVFFSTTGALPTGLTTGVQYFVVSPAANTFQVAATDGGTPINTTGTQSGVHTAYLVATEIEDGDTVLGVTSGATGVAQRVLLTSDTWGGSPSGGLVFTTITGAFVNGEALSVGGVVTVSAVGADTAITQLPNGRYEFKNWNFGGQAGTLRMYGVDGKNRAFEFDGTVFVPITSGVTPDAPKYMEIHKNALFLAFGSSVQFSGPGAPYTFSPIFGAGELTCGDDITDLLSLPGSENGGAMAIKTKDRTFILYGNDEDDFNLVQYADAVGAEPFTMQPIGGVLSFDTQGLSSLNTTQRFGNFLNGMISERITPYMNGKVGLATASCLILRKNQYRIFFSDMDAVFVTYSGEKLIGMTTCTLAHNVTCITALEGASGREEVYFGSSDGYVRQAEIGTSFDGIPINWLAHLTFNHFNSPRLLKTFRKAAIEVTGSGYAEFNMSSSLAYSSSEFASNYQQNLSTNLSTGNWDSFTWDVFIWDGLSLLPSEGDLYGTAENVSLLFSGYSDAFQPITLNSSILHFTPRRLRR